MNLIVVMASEAWQSLLKDKREITGGNRDRLLLFNLISLANLDCRIR
jgi:hypothetical protein